MFIFRRSLVFDDEKIQHNYTLLKQVIELGCGNALPKDITNTDLHHPTPRK